MRKIPGRLIFAAGLSAAMMLAGCRSTEIIDPEEREIADTVYQLRVSYAGTVDGGEPAAEREHGEETPRLRRFQVELTAGKEAEEGEIKSLGKLTVGEEKETLMVRVYSESPHAVMIRKRDRDTDFPGTGVSLGTLIHEGILMSAMVDRYDTEAEEGALSGEIAVVMDGWVIFQNEAEKVGVREQQADCFQKAGEALLSRKR